MKESTEKRKSFIINVIYFTMIIGAFYLFMRFAFWPLFPFLFALFFAMIFQKPVQKITEKTPLKRGLVSFLIALLVLLIILGLMTLVGTRIATEVKGFVKYLTETFENIPDFINRAEAWALDSASRLPAAFRSTATANISNLADKLLASFAEEGTDAATQTGSRFDFTKLVSPLSGVISTARQVPSILIAVVVTFIAACFITADYDRIVGFIKRQLPRKKRDTLSRTKHLAMNTVGKMATAYCIIICITCAELGIGLTALKLMKIYTGGYIFLISFGIALVDILPILGSGTVLIPWAVVSLITGNVAMGIGLIVIYVVISVLRQFIEPRLVAGQLGLPPIVTLMGMYIGLKLFGVLGMFIVPITVNIIKVLNDDGVIKIWRSKNDEGDNAPKEGIELKLGKKKGRQTDGKNHRAKRP